MIRTNIELDEKLVKMGLRFTGFLTRKALVNFALSELIRNTRRKQLIKFIGTHCWQGDLAKLRQSRV